MKKLLSLSNLIKAWTFYIHELIKIIIVGEDKDFIFLQPSK